MVEIEYKKLIFGTRQIWFADFPYEVKGTHRVIFRDCKGKTEVPGFTCEQHTTFVIDLDESLEGIWGAMSSTCRYEIRRAEREGLRVEMNQNFEDFIEMEKLFNRAKQLSERGNMNVGFMKRYGTLFTVRLGQEVLGGQFYLEDKNNIRLLSAPSKRLNVDSKKSVLVGMGNRLMTWEAVKYSKAKSIKEFDFGGYYGGGIGGKILDEPNRFKQSFGGDKVERYIYQKDYSVIYKNISLLKKYFKNVKRTIS